MRRKFQINSHGVDGGSDGFDQKLVRSRFGGFQVLYNFVRRAWCFDDDTFHGSL